MLEPPLGAKMDGYDDPVLEMEAMEDTDPWLE
jgi:hypothetical protein